MVRLVLLFGPLLSLLGLVASRTAPVSGDRTEGGGPGQPLDTAVHAHDYEDDPDRGYRNFGRLIEKITVVGVLVVALLLVGFILSIFGVFQSDVWDPPV